MIELGKYSTLEVVKLVDFGAYLNAGDFGQVLLPKKYVPEDTDVGNELKVFLYLDSKDLLIATTQRPRSQVGQFSYLKAIATNKVGAFLDWGLDKDLLLPFAEQNKRVEEGRSYVVYTYINHIDERIVASMKIDKFLDQIEPDYEEGQEVKLLIAGKSDLGYKAIIEDQHWGLVFYNDIFQDIKIGKKVTGYIKRVREDGKIDLTLQKADNQSFDKHTNSVLIKIKQADGFLPLGDKSDPELIYKEFGFSKKIYKKAIGSLFKAKLITIEKDGIHLV
ncbi:GntR family transcriptional regulator [Shewanella sp. 202IG2-18]|uniref:CvfB family protein n=1 Tax=Parashewanella hymeniacidonis TaxID=2807618 RepID=UPI001962201D|nr:S1-like domain-containing RNA-binding protein [Parashewanella hymeniacidonis]MBM7072669.1 GntR family transcriptional regulator [Parashewanella hymeniacidonis]